MESVACVVGFLDFAYGAIQVELLKQFNCRGMSIIVFADEEDVMRGLVDASLSDQ